MSEAGDPREWLMAHRGAPWHYPENSLPGMRAVLEAGARHVEFDVQLTADRFPVVAHDNLLKRITGGDGSITELSWDRLQQLPAGEPERFGTRFAGLRFPGLAEMLELIHGYGQATAYIELKRASMRQFGRAAMVEAVLPAIQAAGGPRVVLSFDAGMLKAVRRATGLPCGLALETLDTAARRAAEALQPESLFVSAGVLGAAHPRSLWPGPWRWVVYDVNQWSACLALRDDGVDVVETDRFLDFVEMR